MTREHEANLREGVGGTAFCPGCGHGVLLGALLSAVEDEGLDMRRTLFVSGIGCAAWIPSPNIAGDTLHTLHGRAVAFATGAKVYNPDLDVIVVSGDGDLSSIGGNHLIHAARRGVEMTVICANNQIYGMTGGQTASTTPVGIKTATNLYGNPYRPFDLSRLVLAAGAEYTARMPVSRPRMVTDAIRRALRTRGGLAFVEVLSPCPTQLGRRNRFDSTVALFRSLDDQCMTREEARGLSREEVGQRFVVGEWTPNDLEER